MKHWSQRVRPQPPAMPPEAQQVRAAAQELSQQAHHIPGRTGVVFRTVADCALLGTVVISGALASVHLWKALFPRPHEDRRSHEPDARPQEQGSGNDRPPRLHAVIASGHSRGRD